MENEYKESSDNTESKEIIHHSGCFNSDVMSSQAETKGVCGKLFGDYMAGDSSESDN